MDFNAAGAFDRYETLRFKSTGAHIGCSGESSSGAEHSVEGDGGVASADGDNDLYAKRR